MTVRGPIALDGPAASGKTTVGRGVATRLGWTFIDTGLLYRAVGLLALRADLATWDDETLSQLAAGAEIRIDDTNVTTNEEDTSSLIRMPEVALAASRIATFSGVRRALVTIQQKMAEDALGHIVMVGRDIGTVVLRNAPVKIYLDASPETRARRRHAEERARGGISLLEDVLAELRERDQRDAKREDSPLKPAPDAHVLMTDTLSVEQVINRVLALTQTGG